MELQELVATCQRVADTSARSKKIAELAETIARLDPDEVAPAVALLCGKPHQGKIGVGWAALARHRAPADEGAPRLAALTIMDVDGFIDRLAECSGPGSASARDQLLRELFGRASGPEADFLGRVLMGELRQGALAGVVLDAVAKAAGVPPARVRRAAMLAGDLPRTAVVAVTEGEPGLASIGLRPLQPVLPMLASPAADVADALASCPGPASVEWKLDGARIQAHLDGDEVRLFTRNLNDVTARLGGIVDLMRGLPCDQVVLDGEVIGIGELEESPDAFQDTMSRFGRHDSDPGGLVVRFFDCLHLDGEDLIDMPLSERLRALDRVAAQWRVPGLITEDPAEAEAFARSALAAGHEGVMVKAAGSTYEAGRRGKAWRKVKPVITLDLVVLAAEWGHGRRKGWLSNLHLGARNPSVQVGTDDDFVMVGKTFKGLTDDLLRWQTERFLEIEATREGGTVFVRHEMVVEIAVDGAQASTRYPGGAALRFARVKRYRPDKTATDADTIDAVRALLPRGRRSRDEA